MNRITRQERNCWRSTIARTLGAIERLTKCYEKKEDWGFREKLLILYDEWVYLFEQEFGRHYMPSIPSLDIRSNGK